MAPNTKTRLPKERVPGPKIPWRSGNPAVISMISRLGPETLRPDLSEGLPFILCTAPCIWHQKNYQEVYRIGVSPSMVLGEFPIDSLVLSQGPSQVFMCIPEEYAGFHEEFLPLEVDKMRLGRSSSPGMWRKRGQMGRQWH